MWHKEWLKIFFCVTAYIVCVHIYADEVVQPLYEQKVKAGLVYNLLKYTEWQKVSPTAPNDIKHAESSSTPTLKICLFGDDPFDGYLSPLEGRTAQQATIAIIHITQITQTDTCKVVIIHRSQQQQLQPLLNFLQGKNILTISDIAQFAEQGGMVELTRQDEKIELHINKNSVDNAKLGIDARMLKLAKIVSNKGGA